VRLAILAQIADNSRAILNSMIAKPVCAAGDIINYRNRLIMTFVSFLMIATIIIAITLIAVVLIQGQTSAGLGSVFGGSDIYRTRRGMEKTLYNLTFILAGIFFLLSLLAVAFE
jgi:preprotein translocase subunit SecG